MKQETKFSLFQSLTSNRNLGLVTLAEVYRLITTDATLKENAGKFRYFQAQGFDDDADKIKRSKSLVFTPAAVFDGKRNGKNRVSFCLFDDHQFKDEEGKDISHCECCFFPASDDEHSFIAFVEIKDCKAKNVSVYKDKTKEQILSTVQLFKELEIIGEQKVYGIISFPRRKKIFFNDFPYRDVYEATRWVKNYGIHLFASNEVDVVNATMLKPTEYK